jgi:hypothetical protein
MIRDTQRITTMPDKLPRLARRAALACALASLALGVLSNAALALDDPTGIAVDAAGLVYVADSGGITGDNGDISIFSVAEKSGQIVATLKGKITSSIKNPGSVAVSPSGNIYAGNGYGSSPVTIFGPNLAQLGTISVSAFDMFVDGDGDLWVLDANGTVHTYLANNTEVSSFNVSGNVGAITPWGSNVAVWAVHSTVTENMGEAVNGNAALNPTFPNGLSLQPTGVAEDAQHQQYVADSALGQVTVWNADMTQVVATFNSIGNAIAIDTRHSRIYLTSGVNSEVLVYSLKAPYKFLGCFE